MLESYEKPVMLPVASKAEALKPSVATEHQGLRISNATKHTS